MRKTLSRVMIVALVVIMAVLGAGCSSGGGQTLRIGVVNEPATFDIDRTTWIEDPFVVLYDYGLLAQAPDGKFVGNLAQTYEVSADGLTWTFHLKPGIKFQSGEPLTAAAYKARLDRMISDPKSANKEMLSSVASVEAPDKLTLVIKTKQPDVSLYTTFAQTFAAPMDPKAIQKWGEDYGHHPVGVGPYAFVKQTRGADITYKAFSDYKWAPSFVSNPGAPYIKNLVFRIIPDEATRILELQKGNIDILTSVPPQKVAELQKDPNLQVIAFPENGIRYWGFNCEKFPFNDPQVRKAMNYAVNRDEIASVGYDGTAKPVYTSLPSHIPGFSQQLEDQAKTEYAYNPDKAKQVLAADGWKPGSDGVLQKNGQKLAFSIWVTNDPVDSRVAQLIQKYVEAVGAKMDIQVMEEAAIRDGTPKGLHQSILWIYGWTDPDILYFLFSKDSGRKRMHWGTDELDKLLLQGRTTLDQAQRADYYKQAQQIILDNAPWVPLVVRNSYVAARKSVTGLKVNPFGGIIYPDLKLEKNAK